MLGRQLLRYLSVSGLFITVALTYTGGLQGTGDTRSPLFITLVSQIAVPLGLCFYLAGDRPARGVRGSGWRSCSATSPARAVHLGLRPRPLEHDCGRRAGPGTRDRTKH